MYRPRSPEEVCGNPHVVTALSRWLAEWKERRRRSGGGGRAGDGGEGGSGQESDVSENIEIKRVCVCV